MPTPEDLNDLRVALQTEDLGTISALMQRFDRRIVVNNERRALQVTSCDNSVIAHFPLSAVPIIASLN